VSQQPLTRSSSSAYHCALSRKGARGEGTRRARRPLARFGRTKPVAETPICGCAKRSPAQIHCFATVIYNGWRNSNVSSRQCAGEFRPCPGRCWPTRSGVDNLRQSASGAFRPTKPGGKTALTIRPGARPHNPNERWRPSLSHPRGTKKPPAGCPAGGGQLKSSHEHQGTMSRWTRMRSP